jgi:hypothetical protein
MSNPTELIPILDLGTLKNVDLYLDAFYPRSKNAGDELAKVKISTAQIRGLETLVTSTTRFSEILNYIKNQAGKERKERKWSKIAPLLIGQLEELEIEAQRLGQEPRKILDIKLRLAKGWAKQVVTNYLYEKSKIEASV